MLRRKPLNNVVHGILLDQARGESGIEFKARTNFRRVSDDMELGMLGTSDSVQGAAARSKA